MAGIVAQLETALAEVQEREAAARLILTGLEGERKKLSKMLALATEQPQQQKKQEKKSTPAGMRVGSAPEKVRAFREEAKRKLIETVLSSESVFDDVEHAFTYRSLREGGWGHSDDLARNLTAEMRDEGRVRLLGATRRIDGQNTGAPPVAFALVNAQDEGKLTLVGSDVADG